MNMYGQKHFEQMDARLAGVCETLQALMVLLSARDPLFGNLLCNGLGRMADMEEWSACAETIAKFRAELKDFMAEVDSSREG
jgi:hypothetical protein